MEAKGASSQHGNRVQTVQVPCVADSCFLQHFRPAERPGTQNRRERSQKDLWILVNADLRQHRSEGHLATAVPSITGKEGPCSFFLDLFPTILQAEHST